MMRRLRLVAALLALVALCLDRPGALVRAESSHDHGPSPRVFTPFARCDAASFATLDPAWSFASFEATLSLSVPMDTYASHYNYVAYGTARVANVTAGMSVLNVTLAPTRAPAASSASSAFALNAHIHAARCSANAGGAHYRQDPSGPDSGDNIVEVEDMIWPDGVDAAGSSSSSAKKSFAATRDYLVDYDLAASVVIHSSDTGARIACCDMTPNLPDLPDAWSATIEANIFHEAAVGAGANVSYTMLRDEFYDRASGFARVDERSYFSKQTRITNVAIDELITMHRNETFPHGHCVATALDSDSARFLTRGGNHTLASTADFFGLSGDTPDAYEGAGAQHAVRGIPCEKWSRTVTMPNRRVPGGAASTYQFEFYFPVTSWLIRREHYHRTLARVVVRSDSGFRGDKVLHFYDFVDFRPYHSDDPSENVFDPCAVFDADRMAGNCTCRGATREGFGKAAEAAATAILILLIVAGCAGWGGYVYFTRDKGKKLIDKGNEMTPI